MRVTFRTEAHRSRDSPSDQTKRSPSAVAESDMRPAAAARRAVEDLAHLRAQSAASAENDATCQVYRTTAAASAAVTM